MPWCSATVCDAQGYGPDHVRAYQQLCNVAQRNPRVRVIEFRDRTNPLDISRALLSMVQ